MKPNPGRNKTDVRPISLLTNAYPIIDQKTDTVQLNADQLSGWLLIRPAIHLAYYLPWRRRK